MEKRKSILIISHSFPPFHDMIGGMVRMLKLAEFFLSRGISVTVIAASGRYHSFFGYEDLLEQIDVIYVKDPLKPAGSSPTQKRPTSGISKASRITSHAKSIIRDLVVPDIAVFSIPSFYRAATAVIEKHAAPNVLITSPPHSMQMVGVLLKRRFGDRVNLIVDYRDSWNCRDIFAKRNLVSSHLSMACERAALASADKLLYVSTPMLSKINDRFFDISNKAVCVMNGFDTAMSPRTTEKRVRGKFLSIAHFGSLNAYQRTYRDPSPLFDAIMDIDLPIRVVFYGHVDGSDKWHAKMGSRLEIRGELSHQDAIGEMATFDVLLFLHTSRKESDEIVSGKLFDYILARRPILIVGPPDMEAVRIVREEQLGYVLNVFDSAEMQYGLKKLYDDWLNGCLPELSNKDISAFSRDRQYEKVLPLLR